MFKVSFFVEDRHLPDVLRSVGGRVRNMEVVPVVNAVVEKTKSGRSRPNGKLSQDAEHTLGLFCKELKKTVGDEPVVALSAKAALQKVGLSPTSYSHFLAEAVKAKLLKREKTGNKYKWHWV